MQIGYGGEHKNERRSIVHKSYYEGYIFREGYWSSLNFKKK